MILIFSGNPKMSLVISDSDRKELLQYLGSNATDNVDFFFKPFEYLLNKQRWKIRELRMVNDMIRDDLGYMMMVLFQHKYIHREWVKYYGDKDFVEPRRFREINEIARRIRNGEKIDLAEHGLKIMTAEEMGKINEQKEQLK